MIFFILLSLFSFILSQECIVGRNCPYNQGICVGTSCECLDGYKNFFDPRLAQADQIYCNYKQKHHLIALVLEMFLPGFGHFYTYHYWLGLIKLFLAVTSIGSCFYLYHELKVPSYIEAIKKAILNKILEKSKNKDAVVPLDCLVWNVHFGRLLVIPDFLVGTCDNLLHGSQQA